MRHLALQLGLRQSIALLICRNLSDYACIARQGYMRRIHGTANALRKACAKARFFFCAALPALEAARRTIVLLPRFGTRIGGAAVVLLFPGFLCFGHARILARRPICVEPYTGDTQICCQLAWSLGSPPL